MPVSPMTATNADRRKRTHDSAAVDTDDAYRRYFGVCNGNERSTQNANETDGKFVYSVVSVVCYNIVALAKRYGEFGFGMK